MTAHPIDASAPADRSADVAGVGSLRLTLGDGEVSIDPEQTARIGSGLGAHLMTNAPGVELSHATVRVEDGEWVLRDHSRTGVWADGCLIAKLRIDGSMAVRLGSPNGSLLLVDAEPPQTCDVPAPVGLPGRRGRRSRGFGRATGRHFRRD